MKRRIVATYTLSVETTVPELEAMPDALKAVAADLVDLKMLAPELVVTGTVIENSATFRVEVVPDVR